MPHFVLSPVLRGGILMQELSWNTQGVKVTFFSKIDRTVKVFLKGRLVDEIQLKAGQPMKYAF